MVNIYDQSLVYRSTKKSDFLYLSIYIIYHIYQGGLSMGYVIIQDDEFTNCEDLAEMSKKDAILECKRKIAKFKVSGHPYISFKIKNVRTGKEEYVGNSTRF